MITWDLYVNIHVINVAIIEKRLYKVNIQNGLSIELNVGEILVKGVDTKPYQSRDIYFLRKYQCVSYFASKHKV